MHVTTRVYLAFVIHAVLNLFSLGRTVRQYDKGNEVIASGKALGQLFP